MRGPSMRPTLEIGDAVLVTPLARRPRRGDVVVIGRPEGDTLHRVLWASRRWVLHRGDASEIAGLCRTERIVGVARAAWRPHAEGWKAVGLGGAVSGALAPLVRTLAATFVSRVAARLQASTGTARRS